MDDVAKTSAALKDGRTTLQGMVDSNEVLQIPAKSLCGCAHDKNVELMDACRLINSRMRRKPSKLWSTSLIS